MLLWSPENTGLFNRVATNFSCIMFKYRFQGKARGNKNARQELQARERTELHQKRVRQGFSSVQNNEV
jgi:hypothetical protein